MADYLTTDTELTSVANAIRTKGGTSASLIYPTGFVTAIEAIISGTDVSDTTATAGDVLSGKYFYTSSSVKTQGTIATKTSSDLTASGKTVTVPAGYYVSQATKDVATGSATTPATTATATVTISLNSSTGVITATASGTKSITPTVSAGYVSSGTAGTVTISGNNTQTITAWNGGNYGGATTITFTIENDSYTADSNMTWELWVNSTYNINGFVVSGNNINNQQGWSLVESESGNTVLKTDKVKEIEYYFSGGGPT